MNDPVEPLLDRVGRSSNRLRIAMAITAALCMLIAAGIATDRSLFTGGWGWRVGGVLGITFFGTMAVLLGYGAFWRQRRHIARLRRLLRDDPSRIRSVRLMIARAAPYASWSPDDGRTDTGLHVIVEDTGGHSWVLPVSRAESATLVEGIRRRCG